MNVLSYMTVYGHSGRLLLLKDKHNISEIFLWRALNVLAFIYTHLHFTQDINSALELNARRDL
jgi:hypothetical protein